MTIDPPGPQDIAAGLRRLARFVEKQGDGAPSIFVAISISYECAVGAVQLASVVEAADQVLPKNSYNEAGARFDGLTVNLLGPTDLFGEQREAHKVVTETVPYTRAELITRGRDAECVLIEEPF